MTERAQFLSILTDSDLIVLTIGTGRVYCRFFKNGRYLDRMYSTDSTLQNEVLALKGEGDEIDATGIATLKQLYLAV